VCLVDDASVQEARGQTPDGVSVISKTRVKSASLDHRSVLTETKNWCSLLPECSRLERSLEAHTECRRGRAGAQRQKRGKLKLRRPKRWWLSAAESSSERKAPTEPTEPSVSLHRYKTQKSEVKQRIHSPNKHNLSIITANPSCLALQSPSDSLSKTITNGDRVRSRTLGCCHCRCRHCWTFFRGFSASQHIQITN
jgi:hypothetical protein